MPPEGPVEQDTERQLRQACAELRERMRAGERYVAEDMLRKSPNLAADDDAGLELIYTELVAGEEMGQPVEVEEWCARFPHWRARLERLLRVHAGLRTDDQAET